MPVARTYNNQVWSASPTPAVPTPTPETPPTPAPVIGAPTPPPMTKELYEGMLKGAKNQAQELALQRFAMQYGGSQSPYDSIWQNYMTSKYGHKKSRLINSFDQELGLPNEGMKMIYKDGKYQWQFDDRYDWDNITMDGVNGEGLVQGTDENGNVKLNQNFFKQAWRGRSAPTTPWAYSDYNASPVSAITDWTKDPNLRDYQHSVDRLNSYDPTGWAAQYAGRPGVATAVPKVNVNAIKGPGSPLANPTPYASGSISTGPGVAPSVTTPPPTVPVTTTNTGAVSTTTPTAGKPNTKGYRFPAGMWGRH